MEKIVWKVLRIFKRKGKKYNWFWKEKNITVTNEELKPHQDARNCYFCGRSIFKKLSKSINYRKVRYHCHYTGKYRGTERSICNLKFNVPNEIHTVFHNDPNYDYHFIIKELENEFEGKFECLGENTEKYKPFFLLIKSEVTKIDKDVNESAINISYKIKFIDTARFMATSLLNLIKSWSLDNLTEGFQRIVYKVWDWFFEYKSVRDNSKKYKCLSSNKNVFKQSWSRIAVYLSFLIIISINLFCD